MQDSRRKVSVHAACSGFAGPTKELIAGVDPTPRAWLALRLSHRSSVEIPRTASASVAPR